MKKILVPFIRLRFLLVHHYRDLLYSAAMITQKTKTAQE